MKSSVASSVPSYVEALQLLFNSTHGDQWQWKNESTNGPKWSFSSPQVDPCNDNDIAWQGITCSSLPNICNLHSCQIKSLILNNYNLQGTLPSQFFVQLSTLTMLEISVSQNLAGTIPSEIGSCTELSVLSLFETRLSGTIPSELASLSVLKIFALPKNQLTGPIPSAIGGLSLLDQLLLYQNQLTGAVPSEIGSLTLLRYLYLFGNQLTKSLPSEIKFLVQLRSLSLPNNRLTRTIPSEIGSLSRLTYLSLAENHLTGIIPTEIGTLSQLSILSFGNNQLTGTIPSEIVFVSRLYSLFLYGNQLTGTISSSFASLSQLCFFFCENNRITGTIPSEIISLSRLAVLSLSKNHLSGTIPSGISAFPRLSVLAVYKNQLTGAIPSQIGSLSQLVSFFVQDNQLTGTIPSEIGDLFQLSATSFDNNKLTGTIPSEIASLWYLVSLSFDDNQLTGTIPSGLRFVTRLGYLSLADNFLTGTIPTELSSLSQISVLSLGNNQLIGTIPTALYTLSQFRIFSLSGNQLTGTISSEICALFQLKSLYLDKNHLTGSIPSEIGLLLELMDIFLFKNQLTGTIPHSTSNLLNLVNLHVYQNHLNGRITFPLFSFPHLEQLFLHQNHLTGPLHLLFSSPSSNTQFPSGLLNLDVSDNLFSSSIPSTLFLPQLQSISMSLNCFQHQLPSTICEATSAEVISMDGLGSAKGCKNIVTVPFTSVSLVRSLDGTIPDCVWSLSKLKMLNLAGNGLQGRIDRVNLTSPCSLLSLTLSHNYLSGEIPLWLQEKNMSHLDLSNNKLTGDTDGFKQQTEFRHSSGWNLANQYQYPVPTLTLRVNRLSGELPSSFGYSDLDILSGNLFGCDNLPKNDENSGSLSCGAQQYDHSMILMGVVLGLLICVPGMYHLYCVLTRDTRSPDEKMLARISADPGIIRSASYYHSDCLSSPQSKEEIDAPSPRPRSLPLQSTATFGILISNLMLATCVLTFLSLMFSLPIYVLKELDVKSRDEGGEGQWVTHTHMYNWLWTMAFVSGTTPAIILLLMGFICLSTFNMIVNRLGTANEELTSPGSVSEPNNQHQFFRFTVWSIFILNIVIVGTINGLYIWSTLLKIATRSRIWIQVSFALFTFLWNILLRFGLPREIKESKYGVWLFTSLNGINTVLIPCLATALTSPSCYQVCLCIFSKSLFTSL
jgi:Leucine-rich repeat (LRR) protein